MYVVSRQRDIFRDYTSVECFGGPVMSWSYPSRNPQTTPPVPFVDDRFSRPEESSFSLPPLLIRASPRRLPQLLLIPRAPRASGFVTSFAVRLSRAYFP